jgi:hypothetical protein
VLDDLQAKHRYLTDSIGRGYRSGAADQSDRGASMP